MNTDDKEIVWLDFLCANNLLGALKTYPIEKLKKPAVDACESTLKEIEKKAEVGNDPEAIV